MHRIFPTGIVVASLAGCSASVRPIPQVTPMASRPTTPPPEPAVKDPAPIVEPTPQPPPQSGSPSVEVGFRVTPVVGAAPPVLDITIRVADGKSVPLTMFFDPRCVAHYYLDLRITRPDGKPVALAECPPVKAWPGTDEPLAAGAERRMQVPLTALAKDWPRGTYAIDVQWDPSRLAQIRSEADAVRARQSSLNATEFSIVKPLATVRVAVGQTVQLPDGVRLRFQGHSHKSVSAGSSSPLMIEAAVARKGEGKDRSFSVSVYPDRDPIFRVEGDLVFELLDHAYDEWMELRYFGSVPERR